MYKNFKKYLMRNINTKVNERLLFSSLKLINKTDPKKMINNRLNSTKLYEKINNLTLNFDIDKLYINNYAWEKYYDSEKRIINEQKKIKIRGNSNITCNQCGGKTYVKIMQTRSIDEPETLFYTCVKCGKRWKKH